MAKGTIILHLDWKVFLDVLPDEELGQWTRAIMHYMETGKPPDRMSKSVEVAFYASFERIGRDLAKYEKKCSNLKQYQTEKTSNYRKTPIRGVSDADSECVPVPDPVPEPEPYPKPVLSSSNDNTHGLQPETMTTVLETYREYFQQLTPVIQRRLVQYGSDLGAELVCRVIEQCAECGANGWSYVAASLDNCKAKSMNLADYEAEQARRKNKNNTRVDRPEHSGNDVLQRTNRPRRLKREE